MRAVNPMTWLHQLQLLKILPLTAWKCAFAQANTYYNASAEHNYCRLKQLIKCIIKHKTAELHSEGSAVRREEWSCSSTSSSLSLQLGQQYLMLHSDSQGRIGGKANLLSFWSFLPSNATNIWALLRPRGYWLLNQGQGRKEKILAKIWCHGNFKSPPLGAVLMNDGEISCAVLSSVLLLTD